MTWQTITNRPHAEGGVFKVAHSGPPPVYLEVVPVKGQMLLERRIYTVFHWPGSRPQPLILRRETLPVGVDLKDPLKVSKALVEAEWAEHVEWGEVQVLREIQARPTMSPTEVAELEAKHARMREEAKERAAKLISKRKELTER